MEAGGAVRKTAVVAMRATEAAGLGATALGAVALFLYYESDHPPHLQHPLRRSRSGGRRTTTRMSTIPVTKWKHWVTEGGIADGRRQSGGAKCRSAVEAG